jgi:hypothetical protein
VVTSIDTGRSVTVRVYVNVPQHVTRFAMEEYGTLEDVTGRTVSFVGAQVFP